MAGKLILRPATLDDIPLLEAWDEKPHVIAASGRDDGLDWADELAAQSEVNQYVIAEEDGRPVGVMQIIDPHLEPTHYWGEIEPDLRALDIWIGEETDLGRGLGTEMMRLALDHCFSEPRVKAALVDPLVTNTDAHRFYEKAGFKRVERRMFGEDDCYVYRLECADWEKR
ncbi:MAG: GNAT family N-acetyltransferase [Maricaulaceae bacterium]|jgi:aminoglycoside 6'-N-acetyltransferase